MKKISILLICTAMLCFSGCGKKQNEEVIDIIAESSTSEAAEQPVEYATDSQGNTYAVPTDADTNPYAEAYIEGILVKAGELWFMTPEDFEKWCEKYYPQIGENLGSTWENIDWSLAKNILYKATFGSAYPKWADDTSVATEFGVITEKTPEEIEQEMFDKYAPDYSVEDIVYFEPPTGFIASKSTAEKRAYLKEMLVYLYDSEDLEIMQKALDAMADSEIEGMAADMANSIEKDYENYTYKPGDEYRQKSSSSSEEDTAYDTSAEKQENE